MIMIVIIWGDRYLLNMHRKIGKIHQVKDKKNTPLGILDTSMLFSVEVIKKNSEHFNSYYIVKIQNISVDFFTRKYPKYS